MHKNSLRARARTGRIGVELTLRSLRVFVTIEETGSMALAAQRLAASPSGVSQQISNLEAALGARLFDRSARPISLTPAGTLFSRHAHRILDAANEAKAELTDLKLSALPELRLAIIDDLDASVTPDLVVYLQATYPDTFVSAASGNSIYLTNALMHREVDIILTGRPPDDETAYSSLPVLDEPFLLISARGAIDRKRDVIEQLKSMPFVHYSATLPLGRQIAAQLRRVRMSPPQHYAFEASRSVVAMVGNCRGWALMTPLSLLDSARFLPDLDVLPLPFPDFFRTVYLSSRRDELGRLPQRLAHRCQELLESQLVPRVAEIAPWTLGSFKILHPGAEPAAVTPSAPSAPR